MLYKDASVMLKVGGGLSRPVAVLRGIRQGCPLSGMLYSLAIEPLLCKLRKTLQGITVEKPIKLVAYADDVRDDDVTIFIKNERDVSVLMETLKMYENVSTARVNWGKCEGFFCGQSKNPPVLPGGVKWSKDGFKCLGVYLGTETFKTKNWEGMGVKMCSRLSLPYAYHRNPGEGILNEEEEEENFPDLPVSARVEEEPQEESILTFKTPEIHGFKEASKKSLYLNCVKVAHQSVLKNCRETKWTEKRTADLQWRIIHWAVATNRHVAHIDPTVEKKCPFCDLEESIDHLFLYCSRLRGVFQTLKTWIEELGEEFNDTVFIYGLKYKVSEKRRIGIINFLIAETKMAIWVTRKRMIKEDALVDPERMLRGFVTSRIRAEFVFFLID
ncbi:hypothetical protein PO909_002799 [Leuciscus waleckii]